MKWNIAENTLEHIHTFVSIGAVTYLQRRKFSSTYLWDIFRPIWWIGAVLGIGLNVVPTVVVSLTYLCSFILEEKERTFSKASISSSDRLDIDPTRESPLPRPVSDGFLQKRKSVDFQGKIATLKFLNFLTPENIAVICLKSKQRHQPLGNFITKVQRD